jgi:hypothetical protein
LELTYAPDWRRRMGNMKRRVRMRRRRRRRRRTRKRRRDEYEEREEKEKEEEEGSPCSVMPHLGGSRGHRAVPSY